MSTPNDQELRHTVRETMDRQLLPARAPAHTFGGPGNGAPCALCSTALDASEMIFYLEFDDDDSHGACACQVHVRCFRLWETERESLRSGTKRPTLGDSERDPFQTAHRE